MKGCIVFHSYSGITRGIAEKIRDSCGCDLIEVSPANRYSSISAYTVGCMRARKVEADKVSPDPIDVSQYDLVVIGTPVWAWKPTPVINGGIRALSGCEGKPAIIFVTCGGKPGDTIEVLTKSLAEKGMKVLGDRVFNRRDTKDKAKIDDLISVVRGAMG